MRPMNLTAPFVLFAAASMATPALAQDAGEFDAGRLEYEASCAMCHGEAGAGDGPLSEVLAVDVPDLRAIAAANDGKFPVLEVFQIVDGRTGIRGHGYPMPIFGQRYKTSAETDFGLFGSEQAVRARILELVYYLQSIQE